MFSISGMVHLRSKALERTILKIWQGTCVSQRWGALGKRRFTFWTLMLWLVLLKIRLARIAFAKRRACLIVSWNVSAVGEVH